MLLLSTLCDMHLTRLRLRPTDNETYSVTLKVLKGEIDVPVADRRKKNQLSALVRIKRNEHQYFLSDDRESIVCNGKNVLKTSAAPELVRRGFDATKCSNA